MVVIDPEAVVDVAERAGGMADGVLGVRETGRSGERLRITTASVHEPDGEPHVTPLGGRTLPDVDGRAPAVLLRHDFSAPDLERWSRWRARGALSGGRLQVHEVHGEVALPAPLGLLTRLRRQRELARGCRRALKD